ncbi:sulfotransferase domain-containing protein [Rhodohalobacter sp. 8-1]|uniref:sulfotransferase domain-containing protein n=1 Tax=Rhodohalobacter sp. 8-1 TaxID=3131972 RepID=UPI0030EE110E
MTPNIPKDAYVMIIGAMKSGTTSLYNYLAKHPEICRAKTKEPEFFSKKEEVPLSLNEYNTLWEFNSEKQKYVIEASTGYTKHTRKRDVPGRIYRTGIRPKLIYIVRNPFKRIESHYNFMQKDESWGSDITQQHLIRASNYYYHLEMYREYFSREQILLLDFAELKQHPEQLMKRIQDFLEIERGYMPETFEAKNKTVVQSGFEKKLKKSLAGFILKKFPQPLKDAGKKLFRPEKRRLTDSERERVYTELKEDMRSLSEVYGFDVKQWGF